MIGRAPTRDGTRTFPALQFFCVRFLDDVDDEDIAYICYNWLQFFCSRFNVTSVSATPSSQSVQALQFFCSRFQQEYCLSGSAWINSCFNSSVLDSLHVYCGIPHTPEKPLLQFFCFRFKSSWDNYAYDGRTKDLLQFFCFRFWLKYVDPATGKEKKFNFNSSVLDSEPWAYLFLYKFFPTPLMGLRQRVYLLPIPATR